jgi:protein TonB
LTALTLAGLSAAKMPQPPPPPEVFSPPPEGVQRIRIGESVQALRAITTVAPEYPQLAKQARVQGIVRYIGSDGHVQDLKLISGHPLLISAATDDVKLRVYRQTMLNGHPAEVATQGTMDFGLSEGPVQ